MQLHALILQVVAGLATGCIYACIALAMVMIYQATHHINFAQGEMATLSTYIAYTLINEGFPFWAAFALTLVFSFLMGACIERMLLRKLVHAPALTSVGVFVGILLFLNATTGLLWDSTTKTFPSPFTSKSYLGGMVSAQQLGMFAVTTGVLVLVYGFFKHTSLGLVMRAAAHNPGSSRLVGINVGRMLALGWGLAASIGAVGGILIAPIVFLDPNMMAGILIYASASALLGGIDNPAGAVAGGLLLGVFENLAGAYLVGTELKLSLALLVIILVLLVKPSGLFGKTIVVRV